LGNSFAGAARRLAGKALQTTGLGSTDFGVFVTVGS
jgi:hypothetical protein